MKDATERIIHIPFDGDPQIFNIATALGSKKKSKFSDTHAAIASVGGFSPRQFIQIMNKSKQANQNSRLRIGTRLRLPE